MPHIVYSYILCLLYTSSFISSSFFFFFNDTATTEIYTLSLHDALPIFEDGTTYDGESFGATANAIGEVVFNTSLTGYQEIDRKSTRLNSSHSQISYAVFCLKKKKKK